jgi:tetratricopeptide (TPR) repeat protein
LLAAASSPAADRTADLVDAMRERGWNDSAVDFLTWVESSPLASAGGGNSTPFLLAQSQAAQARASGSREERKMLLAEAARGFEQFAESEPASPQAVEALREATNLYAEMALGALNEAEQLPSQAATEQEALRRTARDQLKLAGEAAERTAAMCEKELAGMPKPAVIQADPVAKARRDQLRSWQAESRFLRAMFKFESARTYDPKSAQHAAALDDASKLFGELREQYPETLVGATSRFYQGRCAQARNDYELALGCYDDLIRVPSSKPELRPWIARAFRHRIECLLALEKPDESLKDAQDWLISSRPDEREQAPWLELAYRIAEGEKLALDKLKPGSTEAKRLQTKIRNLLRDVAAHPNEFQTAAKRGLAANNRDGAAGPEPKTFQDAYQAGKTAMELMNSSQLAAKLAGNNNPDAVPELEKEAADSKVEALRMLELAMELADRQTPIDELNSARYYLCWLYWQADRKLEAAVLGEYLARRYPDAQFARGAANLALAALEQSASEANGTASGGAEPGFESRQLASLAEFVATRWPDTPEGAAAVNILISTALRTGELDKAEQLVAQLPAAGRAAGELNLGANLWTQYLRATADRNEAPDEATLALRDKAGGLLRSGFAALAKGGAPTTASAASALYLVQFLLATDAADEAIDVLEHKKVGPLTLVEKKSEVAARTDFVAETYKSALRAYLSSEPPRREEAQQMMEALEKAIAATEGKGASAALTRMYVSLGLQLQRQIKELTAAGASDKAKQVAAAFGDVLARVAGRPDAGDWAIRNWLAQTNLQLGQELSGKEAQAYLDRAQAAFESMLADAKKDPKLAPNAVALLGVRMRLGEVLLARGQFSEGLEQYAAILKEKPNALEWQLAAATALQDWGVAKKDPKAFDQAIGGAMPQKNGKNLIWGWVQLARIAAKAKEQAIRSAGGAKDNPQATRYEDLYYEARFNVAKARYQAALIAAGAARREQLEAAKNNVETMSRLYPDLGGPKWKTSFDGLLAKINQELAKK